jgi:hypothetical protein
MIGGILVSPGEVRARAEHLDADWSTVTVDVTRCGAFPPEQDAAFTADLAAWKVFFQANHDTFWTAGSVNDELDTWQTALNQWQQKIIDAGCKPSGVVVPKPTDPTSLIMVLAIAAGLVAFAYMFGPLLRSMTAGAARPRRLARG